MTMTNARGKDRSNWNPVGPWTGCDFGFCKASEGTGLADPTFAANWANLRKERKPRGAYHFFHPSEDAVAQAHLFLSVVKAAGLEPGDMLVVDSEIMSGSVSAGASIPVRQAQPSSIEDLSLTADEVDAATLLFLRTVQAGLDFPHRHPILVYSDLSIGSQLRETAAHFPLYWVAWPSNWAPSAEQCRPFPGWRFWQNAVVNGQDEDEYNGDRADLDAWLGRHEPHRLITITTNGRRSLRGLARQYRVTCDEIITSTLDYRSWLQPRLEEYYLAGHFWRWLPKGLVLVIKEKA